MKQRAKTFVSNHFSWLSLSIIVSEGAVIFGLIYFFVPTSQLMKGLSGLLGTLLSFMVGVRVAVWFYREGRKLLSSESSSKGNQIQWEDSNSRSIEDALETTDERFDEEVNKITDWFRVDENGNITLEPEDGISDDPKYLLYVIAAKVAHELDVRESPKVSFGELGGEVATTFPVPPFLGKAEQFLTFHHQEDQLESWEDVPFHSREETEVEIDKNRIEGAVEWVETGSRDVPEHLRDY